MGKAITIHNEGRFDYIAALLVENMPFPYLKVYRTVQIEGLACYHEMGALEAVQLGPQTLLQRHALLRRQQAVAHSVKRERIDGLDVESEGSGEQRVLVAKRGVEQRWIVGVNGDRYSCRQ